MDTNRISDEEIKDMLIEMITFLKEWGLWQNTMILALGNAYETSDNERDKYEGMPYVKVRENVDPDDYIDVLLDSDGEDGKSEHLFDMTFESGLTEIFIDRFMELRGDEIGSKAWDYILRNSTIIDDCAEDPDEFRREMFELNKDISYLKDKMCEYRDTFTFRGEVVSHVFQEFNNIFDKHGMDYEPVYDYMIAGHMK